MPWIKFIDLKGELINLEDEENNIIQKIIQINSKNIIENASKFSFIFRDMSHFYYGSIDSDIAIILDEKNRTVTCKFKSKYRDVAESDILEFMLLKKKEAIDNYFDSYNERHLHVKPVISKFEYKKDDIDGVVFNSNSDISLVRAYLFATEMKSLGKPIKLYDMLEDRLQEISLSRVENIIESKHQNILDVMRLEIRPNLLSPRL